MQESYLRKTKKTLQLACFFAVSTLIAGSAFASLKSPGAVDLKLSDSDWPWWRGPDRNGHAKAQDVPTHWSETKNIIWKTSIPGRGHSTPTVVGDNVFLLTADEEKQTQSALCFDRKSGAVHWMTQLHEGGWQGRIHERNSQATPTIACDGERIFTTLMHNEQIWLSALSLKGEILWQKKAHDYTSHWGYSTSPAIYENMVIVSADHKEGGNLAAFDQKTGEKLWNTERPKTPNYASPAIFHLNGQDQIVLPGCEMLAGYDPRTGVMLWSAPVTTQETVGTAVSDGKFIYASGGYPKNETVCVLADDSGELIWRNPIRVYAPSMLIKDGYLYTMTDKGLAHCWNAETGELKWREKFGGDFSSSLTLVGDNLYTSSEQGKTVVFKANPVAFELVAENQLGDEIWATPVICGDRIFIRSAHHDSDGRQEVLYCIGG
jgi:outer membrane protein assembly factor BamB